MVRFIEQPLQTKELEPSLNSTTVLLMRLFFFFCELSGKESTVPKARVRRLEYTPGLNSTHSRKPTGKEDFNTAKDRSLRKENGEKSGIRPADIKAGFSYRTGVKTGSFSLITSHFIPALCRKQLMKTIGGNLVTDSFGNFRDRDSRNIKSLTAALPLSTTHFAASFFAKFKNRK